MRTPDIENAVRDYIAALRPYLEDLAEGEREDLVRDLEQHLIEVLTEGGGTLEDRLGPPATYAAELRTSAGLTKPTQLRAYVPSKLVRLARRLGLPKVRKSLAPFFPGWWVLRGALAVFIVVFAIIGPTGWGREWGVSPTTWWLFAILVGALLIRASVILGRIARRNGGVWALSLFLSATIALFSVLALDDLWRYARDRESSVVRTFTQYLDQPQYLRHADREPITNICGYERNGEPLDEVLLFDQEGRAISNVHIRYRRIGLRPRRSPSPEEAIPNLYPRPNYRTDSATGELSRFECPKEVVTDLQETSP